MRLTQTNESKPKFLSHNTNTNARITSMAGNTSLGSKYKSAPGKDARNTAFNILPGVFYEDLPDLLLNKEQRSAIKTIQALTYLKTLSFIHQYLVFPGWKSQNREEKREWRLARFIKSVERLSGKHDFVANDRLYRDIIRNKGDWARYSATVLFDLSVIQQFRQLIFHNNATSPIAVHAIKEVYDKRLAFLELNAQVWCEEGSSLGEYGRNVAKQDFVDMIRTLDDLLVVQAERDVANLTKMTNRKLGYVKQLALEAYFYQGYKKRFITDGLAIPRFKWQLRSTLSAPIYDEVVAVLT